MRSARRARGRRGQTAAEQRLLIRPFRDRSRDRMEDRQFIGGAIGADVERASRVFGELLCLAFQPRARVGRHAAERSEEHTSELQSLMRISYAVFCLK